jgi:predicted AlkP superfamily phosphohydrolase/phosphomutase
MTRAPKVLFLALDAASKDLVCDWSEQGVLPTFRALFGTSSWGTVVNAPGLYSGAVWPSVWTGVNPGRHGSYYYEQLKPGTYDVELSHVNDVKREPFWNVLGRAGRRVALLDVPKAPLCEGLNGLQVVDWGTHDADMPACSWPAGLIDEIHERYGRSPFRRCDWVMRGPTPERDLREQLMQRIEARLAIAQDLIAREQWDLVMAAFGDSHCVGHQCWHVHDPSHPRHDRALAAALGDPIRDVYVALDRALGHLLQYAGPDTTVLILLSHGMAAHYDATYLLEDVLRRLEGRSASMSRAVLDHARTMWRKLPLAFTERFRTMAQTIDALPNASDRGGRRCFAVPTNANAGGIRLNLAGREPNGMLHPGTECEAFCDALIADLHELIEPASGRPLVREVLRSRDLFPGEYTDHLPDLVVRWNREAPIAGAASPKIGRIVREDTSTVRTGDHQPEGLYFVRGPGITPGRVSRAARIEDFAPTIAGLLDVQLPDVDGRALIARLH